MRTSFSWPVVGWLRSRRVIRDVAEDLRSGTDPAEAARHVGAPPPEGV